MGSLLLVLVPMVHVPAASDALVLRARLGAEEPRPGALLELSLELERAPGWTAPGNPFLPGVEPVALLQLDLPAGLEVEGETAEDPGAWLRNAFLDLPHERLLEEGANTVRLRVIGALAPDAALELNVLTYASPAVEAGQDQDPRPRLIRQRYRVEICAGSGATLVPPGRSTWGKRDVLALGETAPPFELPTPLGEPLTHDAFLGDGLVVLTTYRSCL